MSVGIEAINVYAGRTCLDVKRLFEARGLDVKRFANLMMAQKSVNLPCEDPVSNAVNAAKPIISQLTDEQRGQIELLVVGTESGLDFAKPISTYIHDYLGLSRRCRSFETKHACYGGTAALQCALNFVSASVINGVKALVIASDAASVPDRMTYWEPSQGAGAVAMLISDSPALFEVDEGASGYYSHEVMDTLRPRSDMEIGDSDLSLLSYLECLEQCFSMYEERVSSVDILDTFDYLVFHTPFAGMVKGAHRKLLRKHKQLSSEQIEQDFEKRMLDSLVYCTRIGNVYSAALYLALCSLIDHNYFEAPKRVGLFSYGSGCSSEFYSGVIPDNAQEKLAQFEIRKKLDERYSLTMEEYEILSDMSTDRMSGVQEKVFDTSAYQNIYDSLFVGQDLLVLDQINNFHRKYKWA